MTTGPRKDATPARVAPSESDEADKPADTYMDRLGDRLGAEGPAFPLPPSPPPGELGELAAVPVPETSDVHALPPSPPGSKPSDDDDGPSEVPPAPSPSDSVDAFADFEDEIEGEATRIDDSHLLAEQSTAIIEEPTRQPFLGVEKGADLGREFVLQEGENGLGRGIDNDVILADVAVSRRHVRIIRDGPTLTLKDLGSGNGTQVNGQRVTMLVLSEGDRIEVGETTLVVRLPGASLPVDPTPTSEHTDENRIESEVPPPGPDSRPGYLPERTPSATSTENVVRERRRDRISLSKPVFIAIIGAGAVLLTMFGATIAALIIRSNVSTPEVPTVTLVDDSGPFDRGVRAFEGQRWEEAERAFNEEIQEATPDPRAAEYLRRSRAAREHEVAIAGARAALAAGDGNIALQHASSVPADSPLARTAREVQAQARAQLVAHHSGAGRTAIARGDLEAARRELGLARTYDPTSPSVTALEAEIARTATGETTPEPTPPTPPTPVEPPDPPATTGAARTPPRNGSERRSSGSSRGSRRTPRRITPRGGGSSSSGQREAINAYLGGRFAEASRLARASAQRSRGSDRTRLETLAGRIDRFAPLWSRVERARFSANVRPDMERAIALDRQIATNARFRSRLVGPVVNAYLADARRTRGSPPTSCRAVRSALAVDRTNSQARQMGTECEAQARGMLLEANRASPTRATSICRQIMLMVPSSSTVYREARSLLERHRRRSSIDEDE